jgi:hypothetical protein
MAGTAIIRAKATCMLGTAANGLYRRSAPCDAASPTYSTTVSVKPHSRMKRGGAVGKSR